MPIPIPVTMDSGALATGGLLTTSRSLPDGWERGISFTDTSCLAPVTVGECPSATTVVTPGVNEVQSVTITPADATGGTFTLTFPAGTTAPIAFNADAATVDAAIEAVVGAGNVAVTGAPGGPWAIEYTGDLGELPQPLATGDGAALTGPTAPYTVTVAEVTPGAAPVLGPSNLKATQRPGDTVTFRPVEAVMAVTCTTLGNTDVNAISSAALDQTRDYAAAIELYLAVASTRDAGPDSLPNPSVVGTATDLGADFASLAAALACLEQSLGRANYGRGGVILAGLDMLTLLKDVGLIWRDGARWRTAAGSLVLASPAFDGRAPGSDTPPAAGAALYLYGVTAVWAGVGRRDVLSDVNRSINDRNSRTEDQLLVAFSPCAVLAAASTEATAC